jgi:5'-nucleotidase, C-terminal domain/Lamin Tail Domain
MGFTGFADAPANTQPVGPLATFAADVDGFDVIVGDHTDIKFSGTINNQLVVENKSKGLTYARVEISYSTVSSTVTDVTSTFVQPKLTPDITPDAAVVSMLEPYRTALSGVFDEDIADATATFPRDGTLERLAEAAIGNLVTDALRAQTGAEIAFVNGGGLRSAIPSTYVPVASGLARPPAAAPWDVLVGDIYAVLPFGNTTATFDITPSILYAAMEHGLADLPVKAGKFPQVSGFTVIYDVAQAAGSRVVSITLDGSATPLSRSDTTTQIEAATSDFVVLGGDGYTMLRPLPYVLGDIMAEDLIDYVSDLTQGGDDLTPVVEGRIAAGTAPVGGVSITSAEQGTMALVPSSYGIFTVTLASAAGAGGVVVNLASNNAELAVPASVTIPQGAASTTVRVFASAAVVLGDYTITATRGADSATLLLDVVSAPSAPAAGDIVVNEIMFDVPGTNGDFNCDGATNEEDEFIEIVNTTNQTLDLGGVGVWDANAFSGVTARFVIAADTLLGPGEAAVILGEAHGTNTFEPWCALAAQFYIVGDALAIGPLTPDGDVESLFQLNNTGGETVTLTATSSNASTVLATGTVANGSTANVSQTRSPDVTGAFVAYPTASGAEPGEFASPGLQVDFSPFAAN